MDKKMIIGLIIGAVIIAGGSFYGGLTYANNTRANAFRTGLTGNANNPGGRGQFQMGMGRTGGVGGANFAAGEVIAKDNASMTIKLTDGGSKIIFVASSTQISKQSSGVLGDISIGTQITANGKANADGSVSAAGIQIRPAGAPVR